MDRKPNPLTQWSFLLIVLVLAIAGGLLAATLIEGEWSSWLVAIFVGGLVGLAGHGWQKWSQRVSEKGKKAQKAQDVRALDRLREEDPEAAERIVKEIDSGKASMADLGALVAMARRDALSVQKAEARLGAEGRLPAPECGPSEEDASDTGTPSA